MAANILYVHGLFLILLQALPVSILYSTWFAFTPDSWEDKLPEWCHKQDHANEGNQNCKFFLEKGMMLLLVIPDALTYLCGMLFLILGSPLLKVGTGSAVVFLQISAGLAGLCVLFYTEEYFQVQVMPLLWYFRKYKSFWFWAIEGGRCALCFCAIISIAAAAASMVKGQQFREMESEDASIAERKKISTASSRSTESEMANPKMVAPVSMPPAHSSGNGVNPTMLLPSGVQSAPLQPNGSHTMQVMVTPDGRLVFPAPTGSNGQGAHRLGAAASPGLPPQMPQPGLAPPVASVRNPHIPRMERE